jgi:hypothetical protein
MLETTDVLRIIDLHNLYRVMFSWSWSGRSLKLTTYLHLVIKFRKFQKLKFCSCRESNQTALLIAIPAHVNSPHTMIVFILLHFYVLVRLGKSHTFSLTLVLALKSPPLKVRFRNVRFQVLTAASMMFRIVFWDVLPCKMIVDRRFRGAYCLNHQGANFVRQSFYTAVHPRRQFWTSQGLEMFKPWKYLIKCIYQMF